MDWINVLPNLSIGVVAVISLVHVTIKFLDRLEERAKAHEAAMRERENALRAVEREIRSELGSALANATVVIRENGKIMERVIRHLDTK